MSRISLFLLKKEIDKNIKSRDELWVKLKGLQFDSQKNKDLKLNQIDEITKSIDIMQRRVNEISKEE